MYEEVTKLVLPLTSDLIQPCIVEVDAKMQPGLTTISWTSMNIEEYINNVSNSILKLRTLIITINDLIENRIQKNLKVQLHLMIDCQQDNNGIFPSRRIFHFRRVC